MKKNHLLREARLKKGWSQRQLADFSGLSLSTIERAERGEPLRIDSIQLLCECLNKTPEELGLVKIEDRKEGINWEALATLTNHYAEILSKLADALGVTGDFLLGRQHYLSDRTGGFSGFGKHHGKNRQKNYWNFG